MIDGEELGRLTRVLFAFFSLPTEPASLSGSVKWTADLLQASQNHLFVGTGCNSCYFRA